jgi:hypothetical protein
MSDAQLEAENITYTRVPTINITPLTYGPNGEYVAAGPTAVANIYRPTPQVTVNGSDLKSIPAGTELFFNNAKVVFVAGTTPRDVARQITCGQSGIDANVTVDPVTGQDNLLIRSCNDNAIAIKNGCGGGTLKRVGDFHVVRGFEQTTTTTNTETCSSNASMLPATTGYMTSNTTSVAPEAVYTLYDCGGNVLVYPGNLAPITYSTTPYEGVVLPVKSNTTTTSSTYMSGGSGYQVGDRLRLVGGTPTNNTRGPIGSVCINFPGAGYNNAANIRISFGGDNSVGTGAAAEITGIDSETGSITGVRILNYGVGYDVKNPPSVTVTDISSRGWNTVDANNLPGAEYYYNNIIEVQNFGPLDNTTIAGASTFYRVVANNIVIGAVSTVTSANITGLDYIAPAAISDGSGTLEFTVSNSSLISGKVVADGIVTLLVTSDGNANANIVENYTDNVAFTVKSVDGNKFTISDFYFTEEVANLLIDHCTVEFSVREPISTVVAIGALVPRCYKQGSSSIYEGI